MELHHSVTGFFRDAVKAALDSQHVAAGEPTEFYLVNLLAEFTSAAHLSSEPLALQLARSVEANPETRLRTLKDVGDTSLYIGGFFGDSLHRKIVDLDYYIAIGGNAYGQLSHLLASHGASARHFLAQVYDELARKFPRYVEVLGEVRASTSFASSGNILALCEEWLRTGDERLERRLRASGLVGLDALAPRRRSH